MARWRLTGKHYLGIEGCEWEYREVGNTGKQKRIVVPVPMYLNPDDPNDFTHPELGMVIVAHAGSDDVRDLIFSGPPTPNMEPLDDEARKLSHDEQGKWVHPIESLAANGEGLIEVFLNQMRSIDKTQTPSSVIPDAVSKVEFEELRNQLAELAAANASLMAQLAEAPVEAPAPVGRR